MFQKLKNQILKMHIKEKQRENKEQVGQARLGGMTVYTMQHMKSRW